MATEKVVSLHGGIHVGNPGEPDMSVVRMAEELLELARSGEINGLAVALNFTDRSSGTRHSGVVSRPQVGAMFSLMSRMSRIIDEA